MISEGTRIVCFGDSLTQHGIWIEEAMEWLSRSVPNQKIELYNCGIGGASISGAKWQIGEDVMSFEPDCVLISFGANDINSSLYTLGGTEERKKEHIDAYRASLQQCVGYFKERNVKMIIASPPPFDFFEGGAEIEEMLSALGSLRRIAEETAKESGARFIDVNKAMTEAVEAFAKEKVHLFNDDSVHPSALGYRILGRIILSQLGFDAKVPQNIDEAETEFGEFSQTNKRRFEIEQKLRFAYWIKYTIDMRSETYGIAGFDREQTMQLLLDKLLCEDTSWWIKEGIRIFIACGGDFGDMRRALVRSTQKVYEV